MLEVEHQTIWFHPLIAWRGLCAAAAVARTCFDLLLKHRRGVGHCRFQKTKLVGENNTEIECKCTWWEKAQSVQSLEIMRQMLVKSEPIDCTNSNRAQLQPFHDGIESVNTAQTDWSCQETSEQHGQNSQRESSNVVHVGMVLVDAF